MTTILAAKDDDYFYIAADSQSTGFNNIVSGNSNKILRFQNLVVTTCGDVSVRAVFETIVSEIGEPFSITKLQRYILDNKDKLKPLFDEDRYSGSFFGLVLSRNQNVVKAFEIHWEGFNIEEWDIYELDKVLGFGSGSYFALGAYKALEKANPSQTIQQRLIAAITVASDLDLYTNKNIQCKKFKIARDR